MKLQILTAILILNITSMPSSLAQQSAAGGGATFNQSTAPNSGTMQTSDKRMMRLQKKMSKFDTNHDGRLDKNERAQAKAARAAHRQRRHEKILNKFDTNHDGKLDEQEKAAMQAKKQQHQMRKLQKQGMAPSQ